MPAKKIVSKEKIVKAAFAILRKDGIEAVNARSLAKKLNCSTQPIYHSFCSMNELKKELAAAAYQKSTDQVNHYMKNCEYGRYMAYGLAFVRFAKDEKQLFRYLYLTEHKQNEMPFLDSSLQEIWQTISEQFGYSIEQAKQFHSDISIFTYGLATGMNFGIVDLTDEEISQKLCTEFMALKAIHGSSKN